MHAPILKLLLHALSATVTLLTPRKTASLAGLQSFPPLGAVTTSQRRKPNAMAPSSCEWSIVVDDPITGEPRGLLFTSEHLCEEQAMFWAQHILSSFRVLGTYLKPQHPQGTTGLYLFSYRLATVNKLGAIWAHSVEDATNTLNHMASCGNLLCYCEPEP